MKRIVVEAVLIVVAIISVSLTISALMNYASAIAFWYSEHLHANWHGNNNVPVIESANLLLLIAIWWLPARVLWRYAKRELVALATVKPEVEKRTWPPFPQV